MMWAILTVIIYIVYLTCSQKYSINSHQSEKRIVYVNDGALAPIRQS